MDKIFVIDLHLTRITKFIDLENLELYGNLCQFVAVHKFYCVVELTYVFISPCFGSSLHVLFYRLKTGRGMSMSDP